MVRYSKITEKNKREIVLLKGFPCIWGKCSFCDYTADNTSDERGIQEINSEVLSHITGEYGALEIINSGSVFELPQATLLEIRRVSRRRAVDRLFFESHYSYRHKLEQMRKFFASDSLKTEVIYKCGIETFDDDFRNKVLKKGIVFDSISDVSDYFDSICLLVGIQGQTKEIIDRDVDILLKNFKYGCINLFIDNTTEIKADRDLQNWFREKYFYLEQFPNIDILWKNTDFGVGGGVSDA